MFSKHANTNTYSRIATKNSFKVVNPAVFFKNEEYELLKIKKFNVQMAHVIRSFLVKPLHRNVNNLTGLIDDKFMNDNSGIVAVLQLPIIMLTDENKEVIGTMHPDMILHENFKSGNHKYVHDPEIDYAYNLEQSIEMRKQEGIIPIFNILQQIMFEEYGYFMYDATRFMTLNEYDKLAGELSKNENSYFVGLVSFNQKNRNNIIFSKRRLTLLDDAVMLCPWFKQPDDDKPVIIPEYYENDVAAFKKFLKDSGMPKNIDYHAYITNTIKKMRKSKNANDNDYIHYGFLENLTKAQNNELEALLQEINFSIKKIDDFSFYIINNNVIMADKNDDDEGNIMEKSMELQKELIDSLNNEKCDDEHDEREKMENAINQDIEIMEEIDKHMNHTRLTYVFLGQEMVFHKSDVKAYLLQCGDKWYCFIGDKAYHYEPYDKNVFYETTDKPTQEFKPPVITVKMCWLEKSYEIVYGNGIQHVDNFILQGQSYHEIAPCVMHHYA